MSQASSYHRLARLSPAVVMMFIIGCSASSPVSPSNGDVNPITPTAPSGLRADQSTDAVANAQASGVAHLSWVDNSIMELGFYIERKPSVTGRWAQIGTVKKDCNFFADRGLEFEKVYYYRVRAFNEHGVSAYSNEVGVMVRKYPYNPNR